MKTISQIARFRQSVVTYSFNFGVPAAVRRFNVSRASVYRWRSRFNGQTASLQDKSCRPLHHPNQHTEQELKLIRDMRRRNPNAGLVVFWVKLRKRGYSRSVVSLWRALPASSCPSCSTSREESRAAGSNAPFRSAASRQAAKGYNKNGRQARRACLFCISQ